MWSYPCINIMLPPSLSPLSYAGVPLQKISNNQMIVLKAKFNAECVITVRVTMRRG